MACYTKEMLPRGCTSTTLIDVVYFVNGEECQYWADTWEDLLPEHQAAAATLRAALVPCDTWYEANIEGFGDLIVWTERAPSLLVYGQELAKTGGSEQ